MVDEDDEGGVGIDSARLPVSVIVHIVELSNLARDPDNMGEVIKLAAALALGPSEHEDAVAKLEENSCVSQARQRSTGGA